MFYVEILDMSGDVTNGYRSTSIKGALEDIKEEVKNGAGLDNIKLYKEIELSFTIDVQVKD